MRLNCKLQSHSQIRQASDFHMNHLESSGFTIYQSHIILVVLLLITNRHAVGRKRLEVFPEIALFGIDSGRAIGRSVGT